MKLELFDYHLPEELIAQQPIEPRDHSKLLVLDKGTGEIIHKDYFHQISTMLKPGDVLVSNKTRVIPARLLGYKKDTGANVEIVLLTRKDRDHWEALVKPGKKIKIGNVIAFGEGLLEGEVIDYTAAGGRVLRFTYNGVFETVLEQLGKMPLPPYITQQLEDNQRYQTVYAKVDGSAAAPTAGLHFTPQLIAQLQKETGVKWVEVLLHIGLGTFRPVKADNIYEHEMHAEFYQVTQDAVDTINQAKKQGNRIIAVGTTAVRAIESASADGHLKPAEGWTDIFIYPGYSFKTIDGLITNFHLPKSTLMMLISALAGREQILEAYHQAIKEKYRFFSFGDAMLII